MTELFNWLSSNSVAGNVVVAALGLIVVSVVVIYLIAFFQGRELSFWPPRIGGKVPERENNLMLDKDTSSEALKQNRKDMTKATNSLGAFDVGLFREFPSRFRDDIHAAQELWLAGVSMSSPMEQYFSIFKDKLQNHKFKMKILLVNPNPAVPIMQIAVMRSISIDAERERLKTQSALSIAVKLKDIAPAQIEIRVIDNPLAYEAFMINPLKGKGEAYIRYYGFQTKLGDEPHLVVTSNSDHWFGFYRDEMCNLWNAGRDYDGNRD
jgi:hypothetical protein